MFNKLPIELQEKIFWYVVGSGYHLNDVTFLNKDLINYMYGHKNFWIVLENGLHKRFHKGHWMCGQCDACADLCQSDWCKIDRGYEEEFNIYWLSSDE